ncbi:hypothetical protein SDC9_113113 [bioreactor metagenome]|uniref:Uncharacterized protein n=1 Tax=bioreactor metagenome TaxID=1076179 RepID=A0A645BLM3_9ZZZZ
MQYGVICYAQQKISIDIGYRTVCGTFFYNISTNNGFPIDVSNGTVDIFLVLLLRYYRRFGDYYVVFSYRIRVFRTLQ